MENHIELEKLIDEKKFHLLRDGITEANPADVAAMIERLPSEKAVLLFRVLPKTYAAEVFAELYSDTQKSLIEHFSDAEIFNVIEKLFSDDAADFIEEMPATIANKVLNRATKETREQINKLLKYPENSAGTKMTVEYIGLKRDMTVRQAFERIRKIGSMTETIYTCYVTDSERKLKGVVSVKDLLLAELDEIVGNIMDTNLIITHTNTDQEEVARLFEKYDLLNIPVIDSENRLVGIITVDDIIDVLHEEATEDFEIMAAMSPSEKPYLKTSVTDMFKNRIGWLILLMILGMGTGLIMQSFEDALVAAPLLMTFIPMLTGTGGNAGSQSATMIIRGLALSEISTRDIFKVIWKEIRVSLLAGIVLAAVAFLRVILLNNKSDFGELAVQAAVVSLTLIFTVFIAKLCGAALPLCAKKVKLDPAVFASPIITSIVDASSLLIFFALAKQLLNI